MNNNTSSEDLGRLNNVSYNTQQFQQQAAVVTKALADLCKQCDPSIQHPRCPTCTQEDLSINQPTPKDNPTARLHSYLLPSLQHQICTISRLLNPYGLQRDPTHFKRILDI
ncbi:hypothetical protein MJO29_000578 [Puccinia striiformis f. sp. tritici]|nr:hypothetical protein MJO29_000578 [Puccinia striiformis f. sp. tritici]